MTKATTKKTPQTHKSHTHNSKSKAKPAKIKPAKPVTAIKSFHVAKSPRSFLIFRPSVQTLYWVIISTSVLVFGLWLIAANEQVYAIYDQVDANITWQTKLSALEVEQLQKAATKQP